MRRFLVILATLQSCGREALRPDFVSNEDERFTGLSWFFPYSRRGV